MDTSDLSTTNAISADIELPALENAHTDRGEWLSASERRSLSRDWNKLRRAAAKMNDCERYFVECGCPGGSHSANVRYKQARAKYHKLEQRWFASEQSLLEHEEDEDEAGSAAHALDIGESATSPRNINKRKWVDLEESPAVIGPLKPAMLGSSNEDDEEELPQGHIKLEGAIKSEQTRVKLDEGEESEKYIKVEAWVGDKTRLLKHEVKIEGDCKIKSEPADD